VALSTSLGLERTDTLVSQHLLGTIDYLPPQQLNPTY
jgi:hypothetical protein